MRRDMDLIRALLLRLEELDAHPGATHRLSRHDEELAIEGFDKKSIGSHLEMLIDSGLIVTADGELHNGSYVLFQRISWTGHEFIASVRDKDIWAQTRDVAKKGGIEAISAIWEIAKSVGKSELRKRTGFDF